MSIGNIGTIPVRSKAELPQPQGQTEGAADMAPKGEIAPIGSLKWWTTSRSAKTIQGAIVTIILGLGYEFHVIVEDWRAERRSVVTMSAELVNLIKENQTDRKRLLEMFERQVNILDALSRGQAQLTETSIEIRNMIKGKD